MALLGLGCAAGWRPRPAGALAPDMPRRALCEGRAPLGIRGHMGADGDGCVGS